MISFVILVVVLIIAIGFMGVFAAVYFAAKNTQSGIGTVGRGFGVIGLSISALLALAAVLFAVIIAMDRM